jgi:hypothetical protein
MKHVCANRHCPTQALVDISKLACPSCWASLPAPMREAITAAQGADRRAYSENVVQAQRLWASAAKVGEALDRSRM